MEQQKSQRNKAKDKERDNKKKEYRDEAFDGKGKKGKKGNKPSPLLFLEPGCRGWEVVYPFCLS